MNPEGVVDSIKDLDEKTQNYVNVFKPILQNLYDKLINGGYDYYNGIGMVQPLKSDSIEIKKTDPNTYKKCAALRFINKNQRTYLSGTSSINFIRHIDISDESDENDAYTKREISRLKNREIRCTSYAVDNSWILD